MAGPPHDMVVAALSLLIAVSTRQAAVVSLKSLILSAAFGLAFAFCLQSIAPPRVEGAWQFPLLVLVGPVILGWVGFAAAIVPAMVLLRSGWGGATVFSCAGAVIGLFTISLGVFSAGSATEGLAIFAAPSAVCGALCALIWWLLARREARLTIR